MSGAWVVIAVVALGTFAARASFLVVAERARDLSPRVERVLRMIPPAALAAIVGLQLADPDGATGLLARLTAAAVAALITRWRSNLALALIVGMVLVIVLDAVPVP